MPSSDDDVEFCDGTNEAQDSSWTSPFPTDQVFVSPEDMLNWVKTTAYSFGFVINKLRSKKCTNDSIIKYGLVCDRSGKPDESGSSKKTSSRKTDCLFKLIGKYLFEDYYWRIRVVCDQHNHLPTKHLEGHPYARRLSDDEFRLVEDLTRKNVPPHEILSALIGLEFDVHELEYRQNEYTCMFGTKDYRTLYDTVSIAKRWMIMPTTGLVIASKYNKIVVSLADDGGCTTCFPLWSSPLQSDSPEIIVIAHVNGNHYIRLALREGFPLPRTHQMWNAYKSDIASGWGNIYVNRQNDFTSYYYRDTVHYDRLM